MSEPSLPDKIVAVDECLRGHRVPHAFGGALALAYYAEPRATIDIDLNVFLPPARHGRVVGLLEGLGADRGGGEHVERDGQCRLWWGRTPLDLFYSYDPLHEAMRAHLRRVPFGDVRLPVLAPEHLVVCKALFDRPKDWIDIEQVLVGVADLDVGEIRHWLERTTAARDPRRKRFERLAGSA